MKRISIAGLCLMAVFAFGAVVASSAMATETAEYGQCLALKKGEYTTGTCTTKSSKPHKGKYEWYPGKPATCIAMKKGEYTTNTCSTKSSKPHKGKYEKEPGSKFTSTTGPGELETPALAGPVKCKKSKGSGEITGVKTGTDQTTFEECETNSKPCQSGVTTGVIVTQPLETTIIGHSDTGFGSGKPVAGEVWTQFSGVGGSSAYSSEFECTGTGKVRTHGWVDAKTTPLDIMGTSSTFEFANGIGEIGVLLTEAETGSGWSPAGGAKSIETLKGTDTTEAKIETRI
jgi:hypothetical protein